MSQLPQVQVLALGGTIASLPAGDGPGVSPTVTVDDLLAAVPALADVAQVRATQVLQVPSCEVTLADVVQLVLLARAAVDAGASGCVVTQGTDTLEETAFVLDLLWDRPEPLVVTGAMRTPDSPGADGPANLLSAVRVAASPQARGCGALAVLGDEVHSGRFVRKAHTAHPSAFVSPGAGPLGAVVEGNVRIAVRPAHSRPFPGLADVDLDALTTALRPSSGDAPKVAVLRIGMGESPDLVSALPGLGFAGAVLEGVGGGHVPRALVPALVDLVAEVPVLLTSRTGAGQVLSTSYGYPGGDVDLAARGLVPAGALDAPRARLLLQLALAAGLPRADVEELVRTL